MGLFFFKLLDKDPSVHRANQRSRFQMVSLLKLARVTEEGVRFLSPHDGSPMYVDEGYRDLRGLLSKST